MTPEKAAQPVHVTGIITWYTSQGWERAHEITAPHANSTICGRWVRHPLTQAPDHMPRCGNCTRITNGPRP